MLNVKRISIFWGDFQKLRYDFLKLVHLKQGLSTFQKCADLLDISWPLESGDTLEQPCQAIEDQTLSLKKIMFNTISSFDLYQCFPIQHDSLIQSHWCYLTSNSVQYLSPSAKSSISEILCLWPYSLYHFRIFILLLCFFKAFLHTAGSDW